jgi:hypothetical protein
LGEHCPHLLESRRNLMTLLTPGIGYDDEVVRADLQPFLVGAVERKTRQQGYSCKKAPYELMGQCGHRRSAANGLIVTRRGQLILSGRKSASESTV